MTTDRIQQIKDRLAAATPGSWAVELGAYPLGISTTEVVDGKCKFIAVVAELKPGTKPDDARMMAFGKSDVVWLLAELARAQAVIEAVRKRYSDDGGPVSDAKLAEIRAFGSYWEADVANALKSYDDEKSEDKP